MLQFHLVQFNSDSKVAITCESWMEERQTYWPPYQYEFQIVKAVSENVSPNLSWKKFYVTVLGSYGKLLHYLSFQFLMLLMKNLY